MSGQRRIANLVRRSPAGIQYPQLIPCPVTAIDYQPVSIPAIVRLPRATDDGLQFSIGAGDVNFRLIAIHQGDCQPSRQIGGRRPWLAGIRCAGLSGRSHGLRGRRWRSGRGRVRQCRLHHGWDGRRQRWFCRCAGRRCRRRVGCIAGRWRGDKRLSGGQGTGGGSCF